MKPGERIKQYRKAKNLTQKDFAERLGYSDAFLSEIERGKKEPSREFLKRLNEVFGISSDYILYSGSPAEWEKAAERLRCKGLSEEDISEIKPYYRGEEEGYRRDVVKEPESEYSVFPTAMKKLIDSVVEIMDSGNETMIQALRANLKAFVEAVRLAKQKNEDKTK